MRDGAPLMLTISTRKTPHLACHRQTLTHFAQHFAQHLQRGKPTMNKPYHDTSHDFESRVLSNNEFLKWARKSGFEPYAIEATMLYQMYSRYLESLQAKAKATAKAKPKAAPKVIKPGSVKHTREVRPNNSTNFNKR